MATGQERPPAAPTDATNGNPRTAVRRERTRQKLLVAARVVFERSGFHDARLADIVNEAGVATGTFYNYFDSKEQIFAELVKLVVADLVAHSTDDTARDDPVAGIYAANRAYVEGYRRNARIMTILVQIGKNIDVRELGLEVRGGFEDRISRAIARWQENGLAYPDLDPIYAANALSYMLDRFLYEWTVLEIDYDQEKVIETVSRLWVRGLGLERPVLKKPPRGSG